MAVKLPDSNAPRHHFEWFILSCKSYTKIWSFHQSMETPGFPGFNVKRRRYLLQEYKDSNNGKIITIN